MEFTPKDEVTFKDLATNILQELHDNLETIRDDKKHYIKLANGSAIELHQVTDGTFSIFPAHQLPSGNWYNSGLGAWVYAHHIEALDPQAHRAIRIIAMRAWKLKSGADAN